MGRYSQRNIHLAVLKSDVIVALCDRSRELTIRDNCTHNQSSVTCRECTEIIDKADGGEIATEHEAAPKPVFHCRMCGHKIRDPQPTDALSMVDSFEAKLFGTRRYGS